MPDPVVVVDYDPAWPQTFATLARRIGTALGPLLVRVEHVGGTAIPGFPATPIIDLVAVVGSGDDLPAAVDRLAAIGYRHGGDEGDGGIAGREAFTAPPGAPAHHLYVCVADSEQLAAMVAFRDYLRTHAHTAQEYGALRRRLAAEFGGDRAGYIRAKTEFVTRVLAGVPSAELAAAAKSGCGCALGVASVVLYLVIVAGARGSTRVWLSVSLGVLTGLAELIWWTPRRLRSDLPVGPARATELGGNLVLLAWLGDSVAVGLIAYSWAVPAGWPGFQPVPAGLAVVPLLSLLLTLTGQWLLGLPVDWGFVRGWRAVRMMVSAALVVALAGLLTCDVGWAVLSWGPARVFHAFGGWPGTVAAVVATPFWLVALTVVAATARRLTEALLGPDNPLADWLLDHLPVRYVGGPRPGPGGRALGRSAAR